MIYIKLFIEFCKVGLFSVGGGLATLPFLMELSHKYNWYTKAMLADMLAVSESTPGPIGVNVSTYAGYHSANILGGVIATLGIITPSIIIIIIISKFLQKFKDNRFVEAIFNGLRPASVGLIAVAAFEVLKIVLLNIDLYEKTSKLIDLVSINGLILFAVIMYGIMKFKRHPILYIAISAILGVIFRF